MAQYIQHLDEFVFGNSLWSWLGALGAIAIGVMAMSLLRRFLLARLKKTSMSSKTFRNLLIETIQKTHVLFFVAMTSLVAIHFLEMPVRIEKVFRSVLISFILIQLFFWGRNAVDYLIARLIARHGDRHSDGVVDGTAPALRFIGNLVLFTVIVLIALQNFGLDITALLTGLGVGGIAVALAVQNILGDLFASLSIIFDKPFRVGDLIQVADLEGRVEKIGLKTTRVRSINGEQLVFSNNDLLQSRIKNFQWMQERRMVAKIGLVYDTPTEKLKKIEGIVREAVEAAGGRVGRVHFMAFGDSALMFDAVYFVRASDTGEHLDVQQSVNFKILDEFRKEKIEFAYPSRTLFMKKDVA